MFLCSLFIAVVASPPPNVQRADTAYDWCDCTDGRVNVTVWYVVHNHTSHENILESLSCTVKCCWYIKTDPYPLLLHCYAIVARPTDNQSEATTVSSATPGNLAWLNFSVPTSSITWECSRSSGGKAQHSTKLATKARWWSVRVTQEKKAGFLNGCNAVTGRLKWNVYTDAPYTTSIPFSSFDDGYVRNRRCLLA